VLGEHGMLHWWAVRLDPACHLKYATTLVDAGVTFRNPQPAEIEAHRTCPVEFDEPVCCARAISETNPAHDTMWAAAVISDSGPLLW